MFDKIKIFFNKVWKNIEDAQMAKAEAAIKNMPWSRIE